MVAVSLPLDEPSSATDRNPGSEEDGQFIDTKKTEKDACRADWPPVQVMRAGLTSDI